GDGRAARGGVAARREMRGLKPPLKGGTTSKSEPRRKLRPGAGEFVRADDVPLAAGEDVGGGGGRRKFVGVTEIGIEGPVADGRIVIDADVQPGLDGVFALEHDD